MARLRRRTRGSGALGLAALCLALLVPQSAAATDAAQAAYWWQLEPVTGLIPVPGVPSTGMYVASSLSGPEAISTLRIDNGLGNSEVRLTLHVTQRQIVNAPAIAAYPVTSSWQTGGPQVWSSRPAYDSAARLARGQFDSGRTTMSLLLSADALSRGIALVPATASGSSIGATFAIVFAAPTTRDIRPVGGEPAQPSHSPTSSPSRSPTHSPSRSPSTSPSATHHATHRPGHRGTPSPSASATHHRGSASATPTSPPSSSPPTSRAAARSSHGARDAAIVLIVIAAIAIAIGVTIAARRRGRSGESG